MMKKFLSNLPTIGALLVGYVERLGIWILYLGPTVLIWIRKVIAYVYQNIIMPPVVTIFLRAVGNREPFALCLTVIRHKSRVSVAVDSPQPERRTIWLAGKIHTFIRESKEKRVEKLKDIYGGDWELRLNLVNQDLKYTHLACVIFLMIAALTVVSVVSAILVSFLYIALYFYVYRYKETRVLSDLTDRYPPRMREEWVNSVKIIRLNREAQLYIESWGTPDEANDQLAGWRREYHRRMPRWERDFLRSLHGIVSKKNLNWMPTLMLPLFGAIIEKGWLPRHWTGVLNSTIKSSAISKAPVSDESRALLDAGVIDYFGSTQKNGGVIRFLRNWCGPVWMTYVGALIVLFVAMLAKAPAVVSEISNKSCASCELGICDAKYLDAFIQWLTGMVCKITHLGISEFACALINNSSIVNYMDKSIAMLALYIIVWLGLSLYFVHSSVIYVKELINSDRLRDRESSRKSYPVALLPLLENRPKFEGIPGFQGYISTTMQSVAAMIYLVLVQTFVSISIK